MTKLTLSVDDGVVARAKRYAKRRGTSVSRLVESYLDAVSMSGKEGDELPPVTRRLKGILKGARYSHDDYVDHLERKYR